MTHSNDYFTRQILSYEVRDKKTYEMLDYLLYEKVGNWSRKRQIPQHLFQGFVTELIEAEYNRTKSPLGI